MIKSGKTVLVHQLYQICSQNLFQIHTKILDLQSIIYYLSPSSFFTDTNIKKIVLVFFRRDQHFMFATSKMCPRILALEY